MVICCYCEEAIKSHGEKIKINREVYTSGDPEDADTKCEWCEETGNDILYEVEFI